MKNRDRPNQPMWLVYIAAGLSMILAAVYWDIATMIIGVVLLVLIFVGSVFFANSSLGEGSYLRKWYFTDTMAEDNLLNESKKEIKDKI